MSAGLTCASIVAATSCAIAINLGCPARPLIALNKICIVSAVNVSRANEILFARHIANEFLLHVNENQALFAGPNLYLCHYALLR